MKFWAIEEAKRQVLLKMKKMRAEQKRIRTLAEAEKWCNEHDTDLRFFSGMTKKDLRWSAILNAYENYRAEAATPWQAVEKLRKKMKS